MIFHRVLGNLSICIGALNIILWGEKKHLNYYSIKKFNIKIRFLGLSHRKYLLYLWLWPTVLHSLDCEYILYIDINLLHMVFCRQYSLYHRMPIIHSAALTLQQTRHLPQFENVNIPATTVYCSRKPKCGLPNLCYWY